MAIAALCRNWAIGAGPPGLQMLGVSELDRLFVVEIRLQGRKLGVPLYKRINHGCKSRLTVRYLEIRMTPRATRIRRMSEHHRPRMFHMARSTVRSKGLVGLVLEDGMALAAGGVRHFAAETGALEEIALSGKMAGLALRAEYRVG
jgi:hypothetical protein